MNPKLPIHCPSCESILQVAQLKCEHCNTSVGGNFALPIFLKLHQEEQDFMMQFFMTSGSLKEMAKQMGNSYPTIRNKLDDIIEKLRTLKEENL
ncbi:MAG: DUF2089 domain-containing protein [Flavobacteriia bacterium]|nr:DUF2089 domain-containing protein [Flavobacteriia bacterium]